MPIVIPTGFSQVTLDFRTPAPSGLKISSTTFGVGSAANDTVIQDMVDAYLTTVWTPLGSVLASFVGGSVRDAEFTYEYAVDANGTNVLAPAPPNVSLLVKKVTHGAGRKNRGRMYPPGLAYDVTYDEGGVMSEENQGDYYDAFQLFLEAVNDLATGMFILHSDETEPTPVFELAVERVAATQRRRLR